MTGDPPPAPSGAVSTPFATPDRPRRRGRATLVIALLGFALGLIAMYYLLPVIDRWRSNTTPVAATTTPAAQPAAPAAAPATPAALDGLSARSAALDAQLRALEARMAVTDASSRTAAGYARRAEGMMIAFAARRALDRGMALGYVEGQLRDRFGTNQPAAVATVIAASRNPVTLADLREGLSRIAPTLTTGSRSDGLFATAWRELSTLVIVRRDSTPSPRPDDRLQRARTVLDGGNVEAALAEVARMPGATQASGWIDAAKRYIDSRRAISTLEQAAIGTPLPTPVAAPVVPAAPGDGADTPNPAGTLPGA